MSIDKVTNIAIMQGQNIVSKAADAACSAATKVIEAGRVAKNPFHPRWSCYKCKSRTCNSEFL